MNRKLFSEIRKSCKTKSQRLAFNRLVKSFNKEIDTIIYEYTDEPYGFAFRITVTGDDIKNIRELSKDPEFVYNKTFKSSGMPFDLFKSTIWKIIRVKSYI